MYNSGTCIIYLTTFAFQNIGMYLLEPIQSLKTTTAFKSLQSWKGFSFPGKLEGVSQQVEETPKMYGNVGRNSVMFYHTQLQRVKYKL